MNISITNQKINVIVLFFVEDSSQKIAAGNGDVPREIGDCQNETDRRDEGE